MVIIILFLVLVFSLVFSKDLKRFYNNYREFRVLNNSIIWSSEKKLKLSDFSYEPEKTQMDNVAVTVGIMSVHDISEKIMHRSTTVFMPKESFITNKNDSLILRIAQARFDLCELYRRKMELKISSLNKQNIESINTDSITKYEELYCALFENEWDKFNEIKTNELSIELMNMEKYLEQELN